MKTRLGQVVEHLPSKYKALSSNSSIRKRKKVLVKTRLLLLTI
jgi:hypothetical protein